MELLSSFENENYVESPSLSEYQSQIFDEEHIVKNISTRVYEKSRIKALADERENVQKKTFTKWINSQIQQLGYKINNLYMDLRDGKHLLILLEVLSKEVVPKATRGRMRIHCLENVDKCLSFLYDQKVHLENVGAHDIVDGNSRLTLGLIWTLILRFQVQGITYLPEEDLMTVTDAGNVCHSANKIRSPNAEVLAARDALLLWCQMKTAGYPGVNVRNFTSSWRTGLGFCALIHKHRPDLLDYPACLQRSNKQNLEQAFNTAEGDLGIASLLDPEDVDVSHPDEKSMVTYLASYYHYFNSMKINSVLNKRLNKLLNQAIDEENMCLLYQELVSNLLEWIKRNIEKLNEREFSNSINGVQQQMSQFNLYRIEEKPPKFAEKGDIEVLLFTIKSKMMTSRLVVYVPPDNFSFAKINSAWDNLNSAEYNRELELRKELIRQEGLWNMAQRFIKRANLRKTWISDNLELLSKQKLGTNYSTILAALKKHEAFETDIYAYERNIVALTKIANKLEDEVYHDILTILTEKNLVLDMWKKLLETINDRREKLDNLNQLYSMINDYEDIQKVMEGISMRLNTSDYGKHLMGVDELLRHHELIEADVRLVEQRLDKLIGESNRYLKYSEKDFKGNAKNNGLIVEKKNEVLTDYDTLLCLVEARKEGLLHSQMVWQYIIDVQSDEQWMKDMLNVLSNVEIGNDLVALDRTMKKHKMLETEVNNRRTNLESKLLEGKDIADQSDVGFDLIVDKNQELQKLWETLIDIIEARKLKIMELLDFYQFLMDCDDICSWMVDFGRLFDEGKRSMKKLDKSDVKISTTEMMIRRNQENMKLVEEKCQSVEGLRSEASVLKGYSNVDSNDVDIAINKVDKCYNELLDKARNLQGQLLDELTVYRLLNDADSVRIWITEKEKFLGNFVPTDDIEELEVLKLRFETFENELTRQAEKVYHVNTLSENLVNNGNHTNFKVIVDNQDNLNETWNKMADKVDGKRDNLLSKYHYNNFGFDCQQTVEWILEKKAILDNIAKEKINEDGAEGDGSNLEQILLLQRRMDNLQRDMCAIEAKIDHLDSQGEQLLQSGMGEGGEIAEKLDNVHKHWAELHELLRIQMARLDCKNDGHRIMLTAEQLQSRISELQTEMATRLTPDSVLEAEKMVTEFNIQNSEITNMESQIELVLENGEEFLKDKESSVQTGLLAQRLECLRKAWITLLDLSKEKEKYLDQYFKSLMFFEEAKEVEKILNYQENFLNKDIHSSNLIGLHESVTNQEEFVNRMEKDYQLLSNVLRQGKDLVAENHFQSEKIKNKCQILEERWNRNLEAAMKRKDNIQDTLKIQELLQDIEDLDDSLLNKISDVNQISKFNSKSKSANFAQCKAIENEVNGLRPRHDELMQRVQELLNETPSFKSDVEPVVENLKSSWSEIQKLLEDKLNNLSESDRELMFEESSKNVMDFLKNLENQMVTDEDDLEKTDGRSGITAINDRLKKLDSKNEELAHKNKIIEDLKTHSDALKKTNPEKACYYDQIEQEVKVTLNNLAAPLSSKKDTIARLKTAEQFLQDCDEEGDWVTEKLNILTQKQNQLEQRDVCSLQMCRSFQSWFRNFQSELGNRRKRMKELMDKGERIIEEEHPKKRLISEAIFELREKWGELDKQVDMFQQQLLKQMGVQEFLLDVSEMSSWISEKEFYLTSLKLNKDENQLSRIQRKQNILTEEIRNYDSKLKQMRETCDELDNVQCAEVQENLERNYSALLLLSDQKRSELELFLQYCSGFDVYQKLEIWILAKTKVARNDYGGRDLDECNQMRERFSMFANETNKLGSEKIAEAEKIFNQLIDAKHPSSHSISIWKDHINEIWADLLELIETRIQLLKSAWDLHKWYCDCQFLLDMITEMHHSLSSINKLGDDSKSVNILNRKLKNFEDDLSRLDKDINSAVEVAEELLPLYSKEKAERLIERRKELEDAFKKLRQMLEERKINNLETADFYKLMNMLRELELWMDRVALQMKIEQKPRDVSGVELLLASHRSLKSEIDSKEENFSICLNLGRTLLRTKHPKSNIIRVRCKDVSDYRERLSTRWYAVLDHLSLMVEVYQWARDAAIAETWLIGQESYIHCEDYGSSLDETLALLKKHTMLQKAYENQADKFEQLQRLTTLEIRAKQLGNTPEISICQNVLKRAQEMEDNVSFHRANFDEMIGESGRVSAEEVDHENSRYNVNPSTVIRRSNSIDSAMDAEVERQASSRVSQVLSHKHTPKQQVKFPVISISANPVTTEAITTKQRPVPSKVGLSVSSVALSVKEDTLGVRPETSRNSSGRPVSETIRKAGLLYRKHQWTGKGIKASNRQWKSLFVKLEQNRIFFYKDERHYNDKPAQLYKNETPMTLYKAKAAPAKDYIKRPCVFRLRFFDNTEFLFQASSIIDMNNWIEAINGSSLNNLMPPSASGTAASGLAQSHPNLYQSMPHSSSNFAPQSGLKRFFSSIRLKK